MSAEYIAALTLHAYQTADLAVTLLAFQKKGR